MSTNRTLRVRLTLAVLGVCVLGCDAGHGRYAAKADSARAAVDAALSAWRDGKPMDQVEANRPIRVVDSAWRDGQRLEGFEILREEPGDEGTRQVFVKLVPRKPQPEREVAYVVHGQDPIWVYLEDDYRRMLNMDNNPTKSRARGSKRQ